MTEEEEIQMCLNCKRPKCINCLGEYYHSRKGGNREPVYQISPITGRIVYEHPSIASAARMVNCSKKKIQRAVKNPEVVVCGYRWQYVYSK